MTKETKEEIRYLGQLSLRLQRACRTTARKRSCSEVEISKLSDLVDQIKKSDTRLKRKAKH